jgi:hypothetical protein
MITLSGGFPALAAIWARAWAPSFRVAPALDRQRDAVVSGLVDEFPFDGAGVTESEA